MRCNRLKFTKFRNLKNTELILDNRIIVLAGDNGSGKSTILEGLGYLTTDHLKENLEEYVNWEQGNESFGLEGDFSHRGINFSETVAYTKGKTNKKTLRIEGEDEEIYNSDVIKKLSEIYDPQLLLYTSMSMQHQSTLLLTEKPAERLNKFKTILGMGQIDKAEELILEEKAKLDDDIKTLQGELNGLKGQTFTLMKQPYSERPDASQERKKLEELEKQLEQYNKAIEAYHAAEAKYNQLKAEKDKESVYKSRIEELNRMFSTITLLPEPEFDEDLFSERVKALTDAKEERAKYDVALTKYQGYLNQKQSLMSRLAEVQTKANSVILKRLPALSTTQEMLDEIISKKFELKGQLKHTEQEHSLAEKGKCPTCGQDYSVDPEELKKKIEQLKADISKMEETEKLASDALSAHRTATESNKIAEANKASYLEQATQIETELNHLEEVHSPICAYDSKFFAHMETTLQQMREQKAEKDKIQRLNRDNEKQKSDIAFKIEQASVALSECEAIVLPTLPRKPVYDKAPYDNQVKLISQLEQAAEEYDRIEEFNRLVIEQKEEADKLISTKEDALKAMQWSSGILAETRNVIKKDFAAFRIENGLKTLKQNMKELFHKIYGRYYVDVKSNGKSIDFFYSPDEKVYRSVGSMGGFEEQLFAVTLRFALMKFQDLGFIVLDEIDSDSGVENSKALYENILQLPFEQMFCITHKPETIAMLESEYGALVINVNELT